MIDTLLSRLEQDAARNRPALWGWPEVRKTLLTFIGLLPGVTLWYFWCATALNVRLGADRQDIWLDYPVVHGVLTTTLAALLFGVARFSPRARASNKFGLFATGLFLCGLITVALPVTFTFGTLLLVGIATLYYWLTPWRSVRAQWQPMNVRPETVMALSIQLLERITERPHPKIREAFLPLLDELMILAEQRKGDKGEHNICLSEFCQDFSEHCAPLLGALTYRAGLQGPLVAGVMAFIARYPPFPPAERIRYNSAAYYRNRISNNPEADARIRMLWLKSGLIVADASPKTLPDTLYDLELMLLPLLLKAPETHRVEIVFLLKRFMQRLESDERTLNRMQQNSWVEVLESLLNLPDEVQEVATLLPEFDRQWPAHRRSFAEDHFAYSAQRERRFLTALQALEERGRARPDQEVAKGAAGGDEGSAPVSEHAPNDTTPPHLQLFGMLESSGDIELQEFYRSVPDAQFATYLNMLSALQREALYRRHQTSLGIDADAHFEALRQSVPASGHVNIDAVAVPLLRLLRAKRRLVALISRQIDEFGETNYCNDPARYEYDIEHRLNQAVMQRADQCSARMRVVLAELQSDVESQQLKLEPFLRHLGHKFGALVYSVNRCFPDESFSWLLRVAGNPGSVIQDPKVERNFLLKVILLQMTFHEHFRKADQQRLFNTLEQLGLLFMVRYPLQREACEATLASAMQLIVTCDLSEESRTRWCDDFKLLPEQIYPNVSEAQQHQLQTALSTAAERSGLLACSRLSESQKQQFAEVF